MSKFSLESKAEQRIRCGLDPTPDRSRSSSERTSVPLDTGSALPAETTLPEEFLLVASDRFPAATTVDGDSKREHSIYVRTDVGYGFCLMD